MRKLRPSPAPQRCRAAHEFQHTALDVLVAQTRYWNPDRRFYVFEESDQEILASFLQLLGSSYKGACALDLVGANSFARSCAQGLRVRLCVSPQTLRGSRNESHIYIVTRGNGMLF